MPRVRIQGRDVHHVVGERTQTVNICTIDNQRGVYEDRWSLPSSVDVTVAELAAQPSLDTLRAWLVAHEGQPLSADGRPGDRLPPLLAAPSADDGWVVQATAAVERVLEVVVDAFLDQPYLHRVEHSLHAWLWSLLKQEPVLQEEVALQDGTITQLVHKEWPETSPRQTADGTARPRGLFDLAILSPDQVQQADVEQFAFGRIEAPIVIEVGLDDGLPHLSSDAEKLVWSGVRAPYLLHLSRLTDKDHVATERLLCDRSQRVRSAYVHLDPRTGAARWKHVREAEVSPTAQRT